MDGEEVLKARLVARLVLVAFEREFDQAVDHLGERLGNFGRRWTIGSHKRSSRSKVGRWCRFTGSKKTQHAPDSDIELALKRFKECNVAKRNVHTVPDSTTC